MVTFDGNGRISSVRVVGTGGLTAEPTSSDGITLIAYNKAKKKITVNKVWQDSGTTSSHSAVTVNLYRQSQWPNAVEKCGTVSLTAGNSWQHVWNSLPVKDRYGYAYTYYIQEEAVAGYTVSYQDSYGRPLTSQSLTYNSSRIWAVPVGADDTVSITITNTRQQEKLKLKKVDADDPGKPLEGAEFILSRRVTGGLTYYFTGSSWVANKASAKKLTTTVSGEVDIPWTFEMDENYTYTLEEVTAPEGYAVPEQAVSFTVTNGVITLDTVNSVEGAKIDGGNGENPNLFTLTVPNKKKQNTNWQLKKVNTDGESLAGAEFELEGPSGVDSQIYTATTNADGMIKEWQSGSNAVEPNTLPDGTYTLTETKAPNGYNLAGPWTVTITDGIPAISSGEGAEVDGPKVIDGLDTYTITITDEAGEVLPETGGPGTTLYTMAGMALLLMSGFMYNLRLRRRRCKASGR